MRIGAAAAVVTASLALASAGAAHAGQCPVREGEKVRVHQADVVAKHLATLNLQKGEFETTKDFEARKAAALKKLTFPLDSIVYIRGAIDQEYVRYNADQQRFEIKPYAWDNGISGAYGGEFSNTLKQKYPLEIDDYDSVDAPLMKVEKPIGVYKASNAYGRTVEVVKVKSTSYIAYQGRKPNGRYGKYEQYKRDGSVTEKSGSIDMEWPIHIIPMPAESAKKFKSNIGVAFGLKLKPPYYMHGEYTVSPKITHPIETFHDLNVLVADITCVVLLDKGDVVAKMVATN